MPFLDVTDILFDPDFCETNLYCVRTAVAVDSGGLGQPTQTTTRFSGVVTSVGGQNLSRNDVGEHADGSILICTKFKLRVAGAGYTADQVTWNGAQYTVTKINDYSRYGRGVTEATCELKPLAGY